MSNPFENDRHYTQQIISRLGTDALPTFSPTNSSGSFAADLIPDGVIDLKRAVDYAGLVAGAERNLEVRHGDGVGPAHEQAAWQPERSSESIQLTEAPAFTKALRAWL